MGQPPRFLFVPQARSISFCVHVCPQYLRWIVRPEKASVGLVRCVSSLVRAFERSSSSAMAQSSGTAIAMCNLVVPIRTCSKCRQREPLFHDTSLRDNEKAGSDEVGPIFPIGTRNDDAIRQSPVYMDTAQDCYSRWCVFSTEHPKTCSYCWLTCKHGYARRARRGDASIRFAPCDVRC